MAELNLPTSNTLWWLNEAGVATALFVVTDEMVERAALVLYHHPSAGWGRARAGTRDGYRERAREALVAAFSTEEGTDARKA